MSSTDLRSMFTTNVGRSVVAEDELRAHIDAAPTYQLLLVAVHVTADVTLLDRYEARAGGPAPLMVLPGVSVKEEDPTARAELIEILVDALGREDQPAYLGVEDRKLFQRMSDIAAGFSVPPDQLEMNVVQSGFEPDARTVEPTKAPSKTLNLAIIGAGMTGIDAAVKAIDRGFAFEVFDLEDGPGGLWWSQRYPGVAVDTPSVYYSLSWEIEPNWSRFYPLGDEYRAYLTSIVEKYGLADRIRYSSNVTQMQWLEDEQVWELTVFNTHTHETTIVRAAAVITATGHLNRPKYPNVSGIDDFMGESIHTGKWRDVELDGKRIGVVGVGAAGLQVVAALAPRASHLTVFQRQAHWVSKNTLGSGIVTDDERWLRIHLPYYLQWSRFMIFVNVNAFSHLFNEVDEEWFASHPESVSRFNEFARQDLLKHINETFGEGSELAKKLTPDFPPGGKRPIRDPGNLEQGGYYWAYLQPNVDLVTSAITKVVPEGIVTADGTVTELDVIVWATGMTLDWLSPVTVIGRDGVLLNDVWANNDPRTYIGGAVPGFPNFFVNDGPNTGVANGGGGHNFMTETVNHYIFEALQLLVVSGARSIEVTRSAHDEHNERLEEAMSKLIWSVEDRADTYYRNQAGRVILPSPFLPQEYWQMSQRPDPSAFLLRHARELERA